MSHRLSSAGFPPVWTQATVKIRGGAELYVDAYVGQGVHLPKYDVYGTVVDISPGRTRLLVDLDEPVWLHGQEVDGMVWFPADSVHAY